MTAAFDRVMHQLYGENIWDNFIPTPGDDGVQGWNGLHDVFKKVFSYDAENIIIDVGVWKGQSTISLAQNLKDRGLNGVVIAVDTFLGSPEHWNREHNFFQRIHGMPDLYQTFMSNVFRAGLTDYIVPLAQTSTTAAAVLKSRGIRAGIVHIDAAHEYREVLNDMNDYWPIVEQDGFLIGDDYDPSWPGVVKAADEFALRHRLPLVLEHPKYIFQK